MSAGKKILIVEDDGPLRSMFRAALALAGFDGQAVGDGLDALRRIDSDPPDLLVFDLALPTLGGSFVRQELASQPQTRDIPVVIVTGSPEKADGLKTDCLLSKPVTDDQLVSTVRRCLASAGS